MELCSLQTEWASMLFFVSAEYLHYQVTFVNISPRQIALWISGNIFTIIEKNWYSFDRFSFVPNRDISHEESCPLTDMVSLSVKIWPSQTRAGSRDFCYELGKLWQGWQEGMVFLISFEVIMFHSFQFLQLALGAPQCQLVQGYPLHSA